MCKPLTCLVYVLALWTSQETSVIRLCIGKLYMPHSRTELEQVMPGCSVAQQQHQLRPGVTVQSHGPAPSQRGPGCDYWQLVKLYKVMAKCPCMCRRNNLYSTIDQFKCQHSAIVALISYGWARHGNEFMQHARCIHSNKMAFYKDKVLKMSHSMMIYIRVKVRYYGYVQLDLKDDNLATFDIIWLRLVWWFS